MIKVYIHEFILKAWVKNTIRKQVEILMKVLIIKDQELFIQKECIKSITSATNERGLVQGNCSLLYLFQSPGKKS